MTRAPQTQGDRSLRLLRFTPRRAKPVLSPGAQRFQRLVDIAPAAATVIQRIIDQVLTDVEATSPIWR